MKRKVLMILLVFVIVFSSAFGDVLSVSSKEVVSDTPKLYLKGLTVNPLEKNIDIPIQLMKESYKTNETGPYIITFSGPIGDKEKQEVIKLGVKLLDYIPNYSFISLMTPEVAANVNELKDIISVTVLHPFFKIDPDLKTEDGKLKPQDKISVIVKTFDNVDLSMIDETIDNICANKLHSYRNNIILEVDSDDIIQLAQLNEVKYIEKCLPETSFSDVAQRIINVDDLKDIDIGYDGSGEIIGICDTGIDTGDINTMHEDLRNRILLKPGTPSVPAIYSFSGGVPSDDSSGHGTHVAGCAVGDGTLSASHTLGKVTGAAPGANLVFQSNKNYNMSYADLCFDLLDPVYNDGVRIHSNSWGWPANGAYTTKSEEIDEFIWYCKDMAVLYAVGNYGQNDTIAAPATAKNCISVGASNSCNPLSGNTSFYGSITSFSSRGYTDDGRIKPDIVAPGNGVLATRSTTDILGYLEEYNGNYTFKSGTSMSTPITAGAVAVMRQYMREELEHEPSAALLKAALINGATDLGYDLPGKEQGWGQINLYDSLVSKEYKFVDGSKRFFGPGSVTYTYEIESSDTPLKITLAWTDYPASVLASKTLVDDLDLEVTTPSGDRFWGNDFTGPDFDYVKDDTNNVENVFIDNPEVGTYSITVRAINVPAGPLPFALYLSGDFDNVDIINQSPIDEEPVLNKIVSDFEKAFISWSGVKGATGYIVKYGIDSGNYTNEIDVGNNTNYVATGLTGEETYYFVVTAYNDYDESDNSNEIAAYIYGELEAPILLSAIPGDRSVTLNWEPVEGASDYLVLVTDNIDTLMPNNVFIVDADQTQYTVTQMGGPLVNGKTYYFQVYARKYYWESEPSNTLSAVPSQ